jgi:hypothetical protein
MKRLALTLERSSPVAETSITLTRRELYERVWAVPLRRLCKEFGLSDRGLAKICARHKIPVPARGAWAKKAHGKPARQPPLPPGPSGSDDTIITISQSLPPDSDSRARPLPDPPEIVDVRVYESDPRNRIVVPVNVRRFHRVVAQTREQMKPAHQNDRGTTRPCPGCLDISVSKAALPRAFRIMHALVTAFESRRYQLLVPRQRSRSSPQVAVQILGERIDFGLLERVNQRPNPERHNSSASILRPAFVFSATGRLVLRIKTGSNGHKYRWVDRDDCPRRRSAKRLRDRSRH